MEKGVAETTIVHRLSNTPEPPMADINEMDGWIEQLGKCQQLSENDVKRLCDKVTTDRSLDVSIIDAHFQIDKRYSDCGVKRPAC